MAGILIGLLYCLNFAVVAAFAAVPAGTTTLQTLGTLAGALAFGWLWCSSTSRSPSC